MARRAGAADAALDLADREAGAEFVALTRSTERREHDRLLHDTVLNTLTALARGGDSPAGEVRARCRHDVTLMEYALRDTGAADEEALGPCGGLVIGIEAVAAELRDRGLTVHVEVPGRVPALAGGGGPLSEDWPEVPVPVATALAHAVREALANVASHAGTGEAWVGLRLGAAAGLEPGGLEVTIRDEGPGSTRRAPTRPGSGCAGRSSSGWPTGAARPRSGPPLAGDSGDDELARVSCCGSWSDPRRDTGRVSGRGMVSRDAVLRDTYESGLPRAIAVVAAIWQLTVLFQVLAYLPDFRQHAVVVGVWLGLLAAAVWLVPRAWAAACPRARARPRWRSRSWPSRWWAGNGECTAPLARWTGRWSAAAGCWRWSR